MTTAATSAIGEAPCRPIVTDTYDYDAFGNKINSTGSTPNNFLYRGEQYDPDLGLYYLRARYYNPITGRFMSRDPKDGVLTDPKMLHKYLYAGGDPANSYDPSGQGALFDAVKSNAVTVVVISAALVPYGLCAIKEFTAVGQMLSNIPSETRYLDYTNIGHDLTACVLQFFKDNVGIPLLDIWKLLGGS